jgi:hypothetical protein
LLDRSDPPHAPASVRELLTELACPDMDAQRTATYQHDPE